VSRLRPGLSVRTEGLRALGRVVHRWRRGRAALLVDLDASVIAGWLTLDKTDDIGRQDGPRADRSPANDHVAAGPYRRRWPSLESPRIRRGHPRTPAGFGDAAEAQRSPRGVVHTCVR